MYNTLTHESRGRRACDNNTTSLTSSIAHHGHERAQSESPTKGRPRAGPHSITFSVERKARQRPTPLNLSDARRYGEEVSHRKGVQAIHFPLITPAEAQHRQVNEDGSSSVYTDNSPFDGVPAISPLHVRNHMNVLQRYNNWRDTTTPNLRTPATELRSPAQIRPGRSKSVSQVTDHLDTLPATTYEPPSTPPTTQSKQRCGVAELTIAHNIRDDQQQPSTTRTDQFTPLTPWLMGGEHKRKVSKTLFGDNGWLEDSDKRKPDSQPQKSTSFLDGIKKKAREFAETANIKPARRLPKPNRVTISLEPREQSLLYCELEFILSNAMDSYIKSQLNGGRLDPDKLKKVSDVWSSKGRPRVVGFRYDLETQLELIALHVGQFRFYGQSQINESVITGLLGVMKSNARTIRVRTLCQPDSVIAKQILDSQSLLQLVGSIESLQISLAEVGQFFKVVVEREKAIAAFAEKQAKQVTRT